MSSPTGRIVVAINPQASFGKNSGAGEQVHSALRQAGYQVTAVQGTSMDELVELVRRELAVDKQTTQTKQTKQTKQPKQANQAKQTMRAQSPQTDVTLVVVGGDGMVSMAVNLLAQTEIPFAVVPVGTGNDFARGMGYPVDNLANAIEALMQSLSRKPVAIDLGRAFSLAERGSAAQPIQSRWFAGILSAGFDALVNERANQMTWPRGASRYTWAMLRELLALKPVSYHLTVDGQGATVQAALISVANNSLMGGGMLVAPAASVTDGKLDLFRLDSIGRLKFLRLFPKVFSGKHVDEPEVHIEAAHNVTISAENVVAYADGERLWALPIRVEVMPQAVFVHLAN